MLSTLLMPISPTEFLASDRVHDEDNVGAVQWRPAARRIPGEQQFEHDVRIDIAAQQMTCDTRYGVVASALCDLVAHERAPLGRRFCFCRRMIEKGHQPRWQHAQ